MNGFTQVKTQELTGAALDWVVGKITGVNIRIGYDREVRVVEVGNGYIRSDLYSPSTDWAHGGPMIERNRVRLVVVSDGDWYASTDGVVYSACACGKHHSALIAACIAIVSARLGDVVQVPADLMEEV